MSKTQTAISTESLHRLKAMAERHGVKQYRLADAAIRVLDGMTDELRMAAVNAGVPSSGESKPESLGT